MAIKWIPLGPSNKPCNKLVTKDCTQFYDVHIAEWADYSDFLEQGKTYSLDHIIDHSGEALYLSLAGTALNLVFNHYATSDATTITTTTISLGAPVAKSTVQFHIKKIDSSRFLILTTWDTDGEGNAFAALQVRLITLELYVSATNATTGVKTNTLKYFKSSSAQTVRDAGAIRLPTTAAAYNNTRDTRFHPYDEALASEDFEVMISRRIKYYSKADVCTGDRIYYNGLYMNNVSSIAAMSGGWVLATSVNPSTGLSHIKRTNENSKYGFGYYLENMNASGAIASCSGGFVHRIGGSRNAFKAMVINNAAGLASNGVNGDNYILLDNNLTKHGALLGLASNSNYVYFSDNKLYFLTYGPVQNVFNIVDYININTNLCGEWGKYTGHSDFYLKDNVIISKIDWNGKQMYSINQILIDKNGKKSIYHIGKVTCEVSDSKYYDNLFNSEGFASRLYGTRECY